jgi:hypothetical protein
MPAADTADFDGEIVLSQTIRRFSSEIPLSEKQRHKNTMRYIRGVALQVGHRRRILAVVSDKPI